MIPTCVVTGCPNNVAHLHHAVYVQELRRVAGRNGNDPWSTLIRDRRNLVPVCLGHHAAHHARTHPLDLEVLPNEVYAFARAVLGAGPAYEYLLRRYEGHDARLDDLLAEWESKAA